MKQITGENFGRVVGGALHKLQKDNAALLKELDALKAKLEEETTWRIAACNAHAILSRGIKHALKLKNWPDFYKLYGDGLFSTGVVRFLQDAMNEKNRQIRELKRESSPLRKPKSRSVVSGRKHARKGNRCA